MRVSAHSSLATHITRLGYQHEVFLLPLF